MSTKKEKCNGTKTEWLLEFEKMVKENSFVTPNSHLNVLAIQDFISKAITTAVAKERQRILGLPCMEREEAPEEVHDLDNQLELINGLANFNWNSGRNFLRRELKEEINI